MICTAELARGAAEFVPPGYHSHESIGGPTAAPPTDVPSGWQATVESLRRIRSLEEDWDGLDSVAPDPALVDGAISLVRSLRQWPPPDRTHAGVNGTIYFEWYTPAGYREVEVTGPTSGELRLVPKGGGQTLGRAIRW
jgi:hypothetical protein